MITSKQAVDFANERVRRTADIGAATLQMANAFLAEWAAKNLSAEVPNRSTELFSDGSPEDGREPITGQDANRIVDFLVAFKALMDTDRGGFTYGGLLVKASVNPESFLRSLLK